MNEGLKLMVYGMSGTFLFTGFIYGIMILLTKYAKDKEI